jgi:hypothetical protein
MLVPWTKREAMQALALPVPPAGAGDTPVPCWEPAGEAGR